MPHFYATNLGGGGGGGGGSVTSVGLTTDSTTSSILSYANSPITSSGNITIALQTQAANKIFAGPTTGAAAAPTFRSLVAADIPDISGTYLTKANNLSDVSTKATAFDNISPMTTLGDVIYGGASGTNTRLAGNTTSTKKFLTQTGNGSVSAAPGWNTIVAGDISTLAVTWTGAAQFNNGLTMSGSSIVLAAGTAAAPALQTDSGGKTGIYSVGAGVIGFSAPNSGTGTVFVRFYGSDANGTPGAIVMNGQIYPAADNQTGWTLGINNAGWKSIYAYTVQNSDQTGATAGFALTVRAGNSSGSGSGGALTIAGGTSGSGTAGVINFQTSGATSYQITAGNTFKNVLSANESTGAGSALLGANCPAVTVTAPYTWMKLISSDASTVYIPVWK